MKLARSTLALAVTLALAACAAPQKRNDARIVPGPKAAPQKNVTNFAGGLRCMDETLHRYGVRDVSMMIEEMQDQSRRLGVGTRDMMVSAFADMTRRSRGVRLVTFGQDNQNIVQLLSIAQRLNDFRVVPQFDIRGSITQFDEDVVRKQGSLGASVASAITGPLFGVRFSKSTQASVLGFDASVVQTADLSLMPGVSSKNTVVVTREETSASDGLAQIKTSVANYTFAVSRSEGVAQSLRNMVELAAIELTGKLLRLPYWKCLGVDESSPDVAREIEDWYESMQGGELTRFLQEQLRFRKFYDGPADGKPNDAYTKAVAAYGDAIGMKLAEGEMDLAGFRAFLLGVLPKPPAKPFAVPRTADGQPITDAPSAAPAKEMKLTVRLSKTRYRKGEPIEMVVSVPQPAYVYCFVQSPQTGKIQRIFPNRFQRDPRLEPNNPLILPGAQGFKVAAGAEDVKQQGVGCLATEHEIYNELPPQLRWGDFEDIRLGSFEEIREAFSQIAKTAVPLEGALIDVTEK